MFNFHPYLWGIHQIWLICFSDGLVQPPTIDRIILIPQEMHFHIAIFKIKPFKKTVYLKMSEVGRWENSHHEWVDIFFLFPYAPIPSASSFGVGFGCLNTFAQGSWSTRDCHFSFQACTFFFWRTSANSRWVWKGRARLPPENTTGAAWPVLLGDVLGRNKIVRSPTQTLNVWSICLPTFTVNINHSCR